MRYAVVRDNINKKFTKFHNTFASSKVEAERLCQQERIPFILLEVVGNVYVKNPEPPFRMELGKKNKGVPMNKNHTVNLDFETLVKIIENVIQSAKYMKSFRCDNPSVCGKGAICNSCWARSWAEDTLSFIEEKGKIK